MPDFPLRTKRLKLRIVTPQVYQEIFQLPESERMEFFGYSTLDELSNEKERYDQGIQTFNKSFLYFQLIEKRTDQIIGWCGYHTWYVYHDRAEIGYGLISTRFNALQ